jgi:hypothetical protein
VYLLDEDVTSRLLRKMYRLVLTGEVGATNPTTPQVFGLIGGYSSSPSPDLSLTLKLELLLDQSVHHSLIETMLEQGALRVVRPVITVAIAALHDAA